jgi:hypothetical protein
VDRRRQLERMRVSVIRTAAVRFAMGDQSLRCCIGMEDFADLSETSGGSLFSWETISETIPASLAVNMRGS